MAPDGEIISVGGSVARSSGSSYDVGNINDVISTNRPEGELLVNFFLLRLLIFYVLQVKHCVTPE